MGIYKFTKAREKVWRIEDGSKDEFLKPKYLVHSQHSKQNEIKAVIDRIDFRYHKNFVIFGMRNIDLLVQIYKRKTPFSTMTIIEICEDDNIMLDCNESDLAFLFDNNTVDIVIGNINEISIQLSLVLGDTLKLYNLRNFELLSMPYIKELYPNEVEDIANSIFHKLRSIIASFGNSVEDILWGTDNYINNWRHVFKGIDFSYFENMYKDKPAIIVGAGPSLEKNIKYLKNAKGKAVIMCVDAAMDTLINEGIIPDVVASIERTEITTKFYKREIIPDSIVYLGPNVIPGSILDRFSKIIFTGRKGDGLFCKFNEHLGFNNLEVGSNVASVLIAFAQYIGCSPIIFMGLDLAYTGGKTHTSLVVENLDEAGTNVYKNKDSIVYVKGQDGEMLETFEFFMYTRLWIENQIAINQNCKYINATEGGANIEGAENQKLVDVIRDCCSGQELVPVNEKYNEIFSSYSIDKVGITKKALEYFTDFETYFRNVSKVSKSYYNKLNKNMKKSAVKMMEDLRFKMEEELIKKPEGRFILQSIIISFNRDIHSFPMVLDKADEKRMIERSKDYYDTISRVGKKVNDTFKAYKQVLNSYLEIFMEDEGANNGYTE